MNVKVITRHGPSNYGSILQAIATVKAVESLGHTCQIIDYQRKDERGLKSILAALAKKPEWKSNPLKKGAYIVLRWPMEQLAQGRFDSFRRQHLPLTERYSDYASLKNVDADVYMTGSDQVWGPVATDKFDPAYFLDFAAGKKRVAYAASFGRTQFDQFTIEQYKKLLEGYNSIAVRENAAVETIKGMNLPAPDQVLDPTLLLNADEWSHLISDGDKAPEGEYILVYQIHNNPALDEYARKLSEHTGKPLYRISPSLHQIRRGGHFIWLPTLGKFLATIKNASLMVTDSFHGTAFAINFNTQFVEILPNNGTGSRNQSILALTGLSDRVITAPEDFETPARQIDFNAVNKILCQVRQKSMDILKKMISLCHTKE